MADIVSIPGLAGAATQKGVGQQPAADEAGLLEWVKSSSFAASDKYRKAANNFILETFEILQSEQGRILQLTQNYVGQQTNYQNFKDTNNLSIDPDYEPSSTFAWGLMALVGTIESYATAFFLVPISENYLTAASKALAFSIVNVALGFGVGYFLLRYIYHRDRSHRIWTVPLLPIGLLGGVWYNVTLAFFRQGAVSKTENAGDFLNAAARVIDALTKYRAVGSYHAVGNQASALSADSFALMAVGLGIFVVAIVKGVFHEHPYPGYKEQFVRLKEAEEQYFQYRDPLDRNIGELIAELRDAVGATGDTDVLNGSAPKSVVDPHDIAKLILWQDARVATRLDVPVYMPVSSAHVKSAEI